MRARFLDGKLELLKISLVELLKMSVVDRKKLSWAVLRFGIGGGNIS